MPYRCRSLHRKIANSSGLASHHQGKFPLCRRQGRALRAQAPTLIHAHVTSRLQRARPTVTPADGKPVTESNQVLARRAQRSAVRRAS
jgi:hypothetical protein